MATITGFTAERMQAIEAATIVDARVSGNNLILVSHDGTEINVGSIQGPQGDPGPTAGPPTRQIFTTLGAGTYTRPADCVAILAECIAGGGAGGPAGATGAGNLSGGGAGGSGAYAAKLISNPSQTYDIFVGAGGSVSTYPTTAGAGEDTTFGTNLVKADGGDGGVAGGSGVPPYPGGGAVNGGLRANCIGDLIVAGEAGSVGFSISTSWYICSRGGAAPGPYGGKASVQLSTNASANGNAGNLYGGGGGGGQNMASQASNKQGGAGAPGIIVVTEFY